MVHSARHMFISGVTLSVLSACSGSRAAAVNEVSATGAPTQSGVLAGPIANPTNGHSYYLLEPSTWTAAEARAVRLGGHLATVNDIAENTWIFDTFEQLGGVSRNLWIGLTDQRVEGTFEWISGEPSPFIYWDPTQPDDAQHSEDYVHLFRTGWYTAGKWNDLADVEDVNGPQCGVVEVAPASK